MLGLKIVKNLLDIYYVFDLNHLSELFSRPKDEPALSEDDVYLMQGGAHLPNIQGRRWPWQSCVSQ